MNILDIISSNDTHSDVLKVNLKFAINALTAALVSETMSYLSRTARGEVLNNIVPTIDDQDSEDDRANEDGQSMADYMRDQQGFDTRDPFKNMCILNGLRTTLYNELERYVDIPTVGKALTRTPVLDKPNYALPMSAQQMCDFRVLAAGRVAVEDLAEARKLDPEMDGAELEDILKREALRNKAKLSELMKGVMIEISGLDDYERDVTEFQALPLDMQQRIAEKIRSKLDAEQKRLFAVAVRSKSEIVAGLRVMIKAEIAKLSTAIEVFVKRNAAKLQAVA